MTSIDPSLNDVPDDDPRGLRDYAQREADRARHAETELADLRRQSAFRDAGLDPSDPLHAAVIHGYTGDVSGVGDFVSTLGLTNSNQPPPIPPNEQEALTRAAGLASGDPAPPNTEDDGNARLSVITMQATREKWPRERFEQEFVAEMKRQGRPIGELPIVTTFAPGTPL
jgi:hypothetical protein